MKRICAILFFALALGVGAEAKKVIVFGDSYSTFKGCVPEGYSTWYSTVPVERTDVFDADSTWWRIFCAEKGYDLIMNSSYSGSCVCTTGYEGKYQSEAFVNRVKTDIPGPADLFLIFGGTNDCWCGSPVGKVVAPWRWDKADLSQSIPAMCYMIGYLKENCPQAQIVVINNSEICAELVEGYAAAAKLYGVDCIQLYGIDKKADHPSKLGMRQIAHQLETVPGI